MTSDSHHPYHLRFGQRTVSLVIHPEGRRVLVRHNFGAALPPSKVTTKRSYDLLDAAARLFVEMAGLRPLEGITAAFTEAGPWVDGANSPVPPVALPAATAEEMRAIIRDGSGDRLDALLGRLVA